MLLLLGAPPAPTPTEVAAEETTHVGNATEDIPAVADSPRDLIGACFTFRQKDPGPKADECALLPTARAYCDKPSGPMKASAIRAANDVFGGGPCTLPAGGTEKIGAAAKLLPLGVQDALLQGLAQFASARLKAEVELMVQERLADGICARKELSELLVRSCAVIDAIVTEDAPIAWGTIRAGLLEDLEALPERMLPKLACREDDASRTCAVDVVRVYGTVRALVESAIEGSKPVVDLAALADVFANPEGCADNRSAKCALWLLGETTALLAQGLDAEVPAGERLRYARIAAEQLFPKVTWLDKSELERVVPILAKVRVELEKIHRLTSELKRKRAKAEASGDSYKTTIDDFLAFANCLARVLELTAEVVDSPKMDAKLKAGAQKLAAADEIVDTIALAKTRDYPGMVAALLSAVNELGVELPAGLSVHLPFFAELAAAKDADAVEKAIEGAAAPVGSYKVKRGNPRSEAAVRLAERRRRGRLLSQKEREDIDLAQGAVSQKRRRPFTASLNIFAGAKAGGEHLVDSGLQEQGTATQLGLFMPVGFDFAWGVGAASSIELFVPLIDVGALANFRLSEDTKTSDDDDDPNEEREVEEVRDAPIIGIAQVFAPGVYFVVGLHRLPVALGIGASVAPKYRRVTVELDEVPVTRDATAVHFGGFVAVDIPVVVLNRAARARVKAKRS